MEFAEEVEELARAAQAEGLSREQALVYGLVRRTLANRDLGRGESAILGFVFFWLCVGLTFGGLRLLHLALSWLPGATEDLVLYLGCLFPVLLGLAVRVGSTASKIKLYKAPARRLDLGRLDLALDGRGLAASLCGFIGLLVGGQIVLLVASSDHLGVGIDGSLGVAALVTLDNAIHGIFLDVLELYGVHLVPLEHTPWSATVFLVFRTLITALVVLALFQAFRVGGLRKLVQQHDELADGPAGYAEWLRGVPGLAGDKLTRRFSQEVVFLVVLGRFVGGQFDSARELARSMLLAEVSADLRELLVDPSGEPILAEET